MSASLRFPMPELTVASFNLHWGVDMHGRPFDPMTRVPRPRRRRAGAARVVAAPRPDRVRRRARGPHRRRRPRRARSCRTATRGGPATSSRRPGPAGACGLAMLSRLPVRSFTTVPLPKPAGDVVERRHAIVAEVEVDGRAVAIGGLHASHRLWGSLPQLRMLDRELAGAWPAVGDRGRLQHVGPADRARAPRPCARGARPHVAGAASAQPDRPHLDRRRPRGRRRRRRPGRPAPTTGRYRARLRVR